MEAEEEELDQVDARKFIDYFDDPEDSIGNERQVLLDEWFSDFVIGEKENFKKFFDNNIEDGKEPWVQNEGVQRITQSMVNKLDKCNSDTHSDIRKYTNMFKEFLEKSSISPDDILAKVIQVIDPMLNAEQEQYANCLYTYDWTKHRNTCLVLVCLFDCDIIKWKSATHIVRRMLFEYFLWIIEECSFNWETLYFAVIGMQQVVVRFGYYRQRLVEALQKVISLVEKDVDEEGRHNCPIRSVFNSRFDSFKFQLELCVKWFQTCVLESSDLRMLQSPVRMLPNKLSARCSDVAKYCNVYSNFQVKTNVYYFEVILITDGPMTRCTRLRQVTAPRFSLRQDFKACLKASKTPPLDKKTVVWTELWPPEGGKVWHCEH